MDSCAPLVFQQCHLQRVQHLVPGSDTSLATRATNSALNSVHG